MPQGHIILPSARAKDFSGASKGEDLISYLDASSFQAEITSGFFAHSARLKEVLKVASFPNLNDELGEKQDGAGIQDV